MYRLGLLLVNAGAAVWAIALVVWLVHRYAPTSPDAPHALVSGAAVLGGAALLLAGTMLARAGRTGRVTPTLDPTATPPSAALPAPSVATHRAGADRAAVLHEPGRRDGV